jgi:hypothetical protein
VKIKVDTVYPSAIDTIHFDENGEIVQIRFLGDTPTLNNPGHRLAERSINDVDLIGMYHLPVNYVVFKNRNNNRFIRGFHMPSCKNVGEETDQINGGAVVGITNTGEINVQYPDQNRVESDVNPLSDLVIEPLRNVDILECRSYTLLEYRDRKSTEVLLKVVESSQSGREGGDAPTGDVTGRLHAAVEYSTAAGVCSYSMATSRGLEMRYHGAAEIRGVNAPHSRYYDSGRFGRLFPGRPPLQADRDSLIALGAAGGIMDGKDKNPDNPAGLPAGFTFLGQFIDHDITFDPTSSLERQVDPEAVSNFRTPALELDSVYGAGPGASPHLYQRADPDKLLIGEDSDGGANDLPRNAEGVALIGDPRNDENLIVSQLHVAFLKFHNAVVDRMRAAGVASQEVFREAQQRVRWHYQWMIVHEFLPHIIGKETVKKLAEGRTIYDWRHEPFIPVEFSVAAYRFGHSQVRPGYRINADFARPIFAAQSAGGADGLPNDLSGGRRIRPQQVIDWREFFKLDDSKPQVGKAIDVKLSSPLLNLPFPSGTPEDPKSLAVRNLLRHLTLGVPSGQNVARAMDEEPLDQKELHDLRDLDLDRDTPLWFYILREAELQPKGAYLGPVGGRIVGEVVLGLLEGDRLSYLRAGGRWTPDLGAGNDFKMADLLKFAGVA